MPFWHTDCFSSLSRSGENRPGSAGETRAKSIPDKYADWKESRVGMQPPRASASLASRLLGFFGEGCFLRGCAAGSRPGDGVNPALAGFVAGRRVAKCRAAALGRGSATLDNGSGRQVDRRSFISFSSILDRNRISRGFDRCQDTLRVCLALPEKPEPARFAASTPTGKRAGWVCDPPGRAPLLPVGCFSFGLAFCRSLLRTGRRRAQPPSPSRVATARDETLSGRVRHGAGGVGCRFPAPSSPHFPSSNPRLATWA